MFTLSGIALLLFVIMYLFMIFAPKIRLFAIWGTVILFVVLRILHAVPAYLFSVINWNVIMMIGGTMLIVYYFTESRMPNRMAEIILEHCPNIMWVIILMSLFAGLVSAFIDNVATVLMIAPVALAVCKKLDISPVPMLLSVAVSSNLQGAATLVGDTTSIMLGDYAHMNFMHFFWMLGRPGMFWSVELGALMTVPVMLVLFHSFRQPVESTGKTVIQNRFPTIALVGVVVCLILASFVPDTPDTINGIICIVIALITMAEDYLRNRNPRNLHHALLSVDVETLLVLMGLFLVIRGISDVGLIDLAANLIVNAGGSNLFLLYTIIVWGSVLFSAFIDNIPYVATMLPIITGICSLLQIEPYLLYFGLLTGATLGGNITPIGASANITAVGILKQNGYSVSFTDFMKIGVPFTLIAVTTGYLFIWLFWA